MASKRAVPPPALPGPDERAYAVRWHRSRKCLTADPETTWRWSEPSQATLMTRAEADAAAARMGGMVCLDGVPVDKLGVEPPKRPALPKAPKRPAGAESPAVVRVREAVAASQWREATRLAVKLRGLGDDAKLLERAWDGFARPGFCRQVKRDPEALIATGIEVLRRRFGAP